MRVTNLRLTIATDETGHVLDVTVSPISLPPVVPVGNHKVIGPTPPPVPVLCGNIPGKVTPPAESVLKRSLIAHIPPAPVMVQHPVYGSLPASSWKPIRTPFGHAHYGGLNFAQSTKDPTSRLARIVNYIRQNGPTSRNELLTHALHIPATYVGHWDRKRHARCTGHSTPFFSLAQKCDFIRATRKGNRVVYSLGRRARLVVKTNGVRIVVK